MNKPSTPDERSRLLLALDRMIESVQEEMRQNDPGNTATFGALNGELKGLMAARTYAELEAARTAVPECGTLSMSQVNDPNDWSPKEDFDALTFASYTDAKKAEVLFNRLMRELDFKDNELGRFQESNRQAQETNDDLRQQLSWAIEDSKAIVLENAKLAEQLAAARSTNGTPMSKLNNDLFVEQWDRLTAALGMRHRENVIDVTDEALRRIALSARQP